MSSSDSSWVSLTKSQVADHRLVMKRVIVQENRLNLEKEMNRCQIPDGRMSNELQNPFPAEVWGLIFDELETPKDIQNCYSSCHLFKNLLVRKSHLWLFRKVLPMLLNGSYLTVGDVLGCRLVSKLWCRSVDTFMESEDSWKTRRETGDLKIKEPFITRARKVQRVIFHDQRNPFISRALCIIVEFNIPNAVLYRGNNIWYLEMPHYIEGWQLGLSNLILILTYLPNLRKLVLNINWSNINFRNFSGWRPQTFARLNHVNLTSLSIYCDRKDTPTREKLQTLQDGLVGVFSSQLKELKIECWNSAYSQHVWSNLETLHLGWRGFSNRFSENQYPFSTTPESTNDRLSSTELLKSLCKLPASKLKNLWIQLGGKNGNKNLELLLRTINHFPQLDALLLQFDWQWKITDKQVMSFPVTLPDLCSVSLKSLHLRTGYSDKITYNFLMYFPHLQFLHIAYACPGLDSAKDVTDDNWIGYNQVRSIRNQEMYSKTCAQRLHEVVEIREYMYTRRDEIANSNMWNILPFLRQLTITDYLIYSYKHIPKSQLFRRT